LNLNSYDEKVNTLLRTQRNVK